MVMANPILPTARDISLISNAQPLPAGVDSQDAWRDGIQFAGLWELVAATAYTLSCDPDQVDLDDDPLPHPEVSFKPFSAYVMAGCEAITPGLGEQQTAYAMAVMEATLTKAMEAQFWGGTVDQTIPHLMSTATVVGSGSGHTPARAIEKLLSNRESASGVTLVHGPASMVPVLAKDQLIERRNGALFGMDSYRYVPGVGYPRVGVGSSGPWQTPLAFPEGFDDSDRGVGAGTKGTVGTETADQCWFYATGAVEYGVGPIFGNLGGQHVPYDGSTFWDARTNRWLIMPQRQMIYRFDPTGVMAVKVNVPT